jgi:chemotaxis protein methyltransferase CheR
MSAYDELFLLKSIDRGRLTAGDGTIAAYADRLAGCRAEAETFCQSLRIAYSEFFRDPLVFALLERSVLPSLVPANGESGQREIRIWSAGCAAGQEAWSVAILLDELSSTLPQPLPFRIFATDLPGPDLDLARSGVYSPEAVGNVRFRHLRTHFSRNGESYAILPRLRDRVEFSAYDLLDARSASPAESIYGDFDLVLCCNLLFYYRPPVRTRVLAKIRRALAPGGYLVTGGAEREIVGRQSGLRPLNPDASVFQAKGRP